MIWETAVRLRERYDLVVAAHDGASADGTGEGMSFVRAPVAGDRRRALLVDFQNGARRRLHLRDTPYVARTSYFRAYARAQAANLAGREVELVHLHNTPQWVPALHAAMPTARVVLQMHCEWLSELPRTTAGLDGVARVVAVSEQIAAGIREHRPERADDVVVVPNGVDTTRFRPRGRTDPERLRHELGLHDGPVILFVGRLSAEKGLHVLLEALPRIAAAAPTAQVVLVGPAHGLRSPLPTLERVELQGKLEWRARYVDHLRRLAAHAPLDVHFAGKISHESLPLVYALADVYVQPSVFEAFGLPVVEAMAAGVPVVVSSGGALPELVRPDGAGIVVPTGDAGALGDAVAAILGDRSLAVRLGAAGRARAVRDFSWETVADRLAAVYDDVLRER